MKLNVYAYVCLNAQVKNILAFKGGSFIFIWAVSW